MQSRISAWISLACFVLAGVLTPASAHRPDRNEAREARRPSNPSQQSNLRQPSNLHQPSNPRRRSNLRRRRTCAGGATRASCRARLYQAWRGHRPSVTTRVQNFRCSRSSRPSTRNRGRAHPFAKLQCETCHGPAPNMPRKFPGTEAGANHQVRPRCCRSRSRTRSAWLPPEPGAYRLEDSPHGGNDVACASCHRFTRNTTRCWRRRRNLERCATPVTRCNAPSSTSPRCIRCASRRCIAAPPRGSWLDGSET